MDRIGSCKCRKTVLRLLENALSTGSEDVSGCRGVIRDLLGPDAHR